MAKEFRTRFVQPRPISALNFLLYTFLLAAGGTAFRLLPDHPGMFILVLTAVLLTYAVLSLCLASISHVLEARQQRLRDRRAQDIFSAVRHGERRYYSLYLRGFDSMGKLRDSFDESDGVIDTELLIGTLVETTAPLIALGRPGVDHFGAGRIATTDASWKADFETLVQEATVVFLVPTDTPGTIFEIDYIVKQRLWFKTVLFMPRGGRPYNWEERWESTRTRVKDVGLVLPTFEWSGGVFRLGPTGEVETFRPISPKSVMNAVADVVVDLMSDRLALLGSPQDRIRS